MSPMCGAVVGSYLLSVIAVLVAIYFAYRREWTFAAFAAFIPLVESGLYRLTSLAAPRQRPDVPRLEDLTPDASFPSGHVAASVAVYGGLAFVLSSRIEHAPTRYGVRAVVVLTIAFAALSRMYQGMHHPTRRRRRRSRRFDGDRDHRLRLPCGRRGLNPKGDVLMAGCRTSRSPSARPRARARPSRSLPGSSGGPRRPRRARRRLHHHRRPRRRPGDRCGRPGGQPGGGPPGDRPAVVWHVPPDPDGDRARRLRDLAPRPRGDRPRTRRTPTARSTGSAASSAGSAT